MFIFIYSLLVRRLKVDFNIDNRYFMTKVIYLLSCIFNMHAEVNVTETRATNSSFYLGL